MSQEILSSTGSIGLERRSYERLYCNWRYGMLQADSAWFDRWMARAKSHLQSRPSSRVVFRSFLDTHSMGELSRSQAAQSVEAVVPLESHAGEPVWMVLFGVNGQERAQQSRRPDFVPEVRRSPVARMQSLSQEGAELFPTIQEEFIEGLSHIWTPTFGWTCDEIDHLRHRLERQTSSNTDVWFSGLVIDNTLVSAAMAERLRIPLDQRRSVSVIESTEWGTLPAYARNGYMAATVSYLHAQVLRDIAPQSDPWVLVAETNITSGAHFVGNAVGLEVPSIHIGQMEVPQTLRQNVVVNDGILPSEQLRDFSMMYLPHRNISLYQEKL